VIIIHPVNTIKVLASDKTMRGELFKESVSTAAEGGCCKECQLFSYKQNQKCSSWL